MLFFPASTFPFSTSPSSFVCSFSAIVLLLLSFSARADVFLLNPADNGEVGSPIESAFITFDCTLPSNVTGLASPLIALAWEATILSVCRSLTDYYVNLQNYTNITAAIVGVPTFYRTDDLSLGYYPADDPSLFTLKVTYVVTADYNTLMEPNLTGRFDTDRGQFYDYTVSVQMYLFRSVFPALYFVLSIWCLYLLFIEIKFNGLSTRRSIQIIVCAIFMTLLRGFKVAYEEQLAYYMPAPRPPPVIAVDIILFWLPVVLGTQMYTLASFGWASVVQALHANKLIEYMRRPLIGFFYALSPFVIIVSVLSVVFDFSTLMIFCVLIICVGFFEAFVFLFFGTKILRIMSLVKEVNTESASTEKRILIFMILTVSCWILAVLMAIIFMVVTMMTTTNAMPVFIAAVFRDILMLNLVFIIMYLVSRPTRKLATADKGTSTAAEDRPGSGTSSMNTTQITLANGARAHSNRDSGTESV